MRKLLQVFILSFCFVSLQAQQTVISDSATYSVITCSPGEEVYSKFGHTALRINDSISGADLVFNYGIFSFETENFYYKFIKGETDYQLGVYDTQLFLQEYSARNSFVWEQVLNLTVPEKQKLKNALITNCEPQNRVYRYNFIFDNCATRPRDQILAAKNGFVIFPNNSNPKTFRQWVSVYVGTDTWLKYGIDLVFGLDADKYASVSESLFLPEVLMEELQSARVLLKNKEEIKLVSDRKLLNEKKEKNNSSEASWFFEPLFITIILLILGTIVSIRDYIKKEYTVPFDATLYFITGMAGLLLLYLMLFSSHPLVKNNFNILWLNPLNILLAVFVWIRSLKVFLFFYQIVNILFLVIALFAFAISMQDFNIANYPIIVLLLMRSTIWFAITKKRIYKKRRNLDNL